MRTTPGTGTHSGTTTQRTSRAIDPGLRAITRAAGIGVLFFTLLQFIPQALSANQFPEPHLILGFGVSIAIFILTAHMSNRGLKNQQHTTASTLGTVLIWILATWVLVQTVFRPSWEELLRSVAFASLLVSANSLGRYLAVDGRYRQFLAGLAPYFVIGYICGFLVALYNPLAIWWGHGLFGDSHTRSWFFWLLTPQPLFAAAAFYWARRETCIPRTARFYTMCLIILFIFLVMTRTRTYLVTVAAFLVLLFVARSFARTFLSIGGLTLAVLASPSLVASIGKFTRLSSFVTGIDPVSGSADITNARGELSHSLLDLFNESPSTGAGASEVRSSISTLAASSEAGILLTMASYGVLALLLIAFSGMALFVSCNRVATQTDDYPLYCLAMVIAPFATVLFFGTSTGFSDWLALAVLSIALNLKFSKDSSAPKVPPPENGALMMRGTGRFRRRPPVHRGSSRPRAVAGSRTRAPWTAHSDWSA